MKSKPIALEKGYAAEVDTVDGDKWTKITEQFSDANIYQTWAYDAIRCGEERISHLVLRTDDKIISAAQARIVRIPIVGLGVAYVRWAPLWHLRNQREDQVTFQYAVRALRNEYVCRRGLILRILPILYDDNFNLYIDTLRREGYSLAPEKARSRTLVLDISQPLEELRKNMDQKWRNCLNRAERNELNVIEGTEDSLFRDFIDLYRDLLRRKKFPEPNDISDFRAIQRDLPTKHKMNVILCRSGGTNSVGGVFAAIGETGVYLFGATNEQGMENKGSYLVQWKAIQWMKKSGCLYYNLNGINPATNPGTYHFKAGLAGKRGKDVNYLGLFDSFPSPIHGVLVRTADMVFPFLKRTIAASGLRSRSKANEI